MLDRFNSNQKKIFLIALVILFLICMLIINKNNNTEYIPIDEEMLVTNNSTGNVITEEKEQIVIHITGAVKMPGIVKLPEGSRIEDAINKAGGLTETADISNVNLAYILEDGLKIKIPSILDIEKNDADSVINSNSGKNILENSEDLSQGLHININKATEHDLLNLPGIGQSLASRIIDYRDKNGKFSSIDDIKKVNGIGDSKYENIKELIYVK